jgi:hypothetical protein
MPDLLDQVSRNRFRTPFDVNQYIFRYWQLASGQFTPVSPVSRGKFLRIENHNEHIEAALNDPKIKMVCINDSPYKIDFEQAMAQIIAIFEKKLPNKSSFEK